MDALEARHLAELRFAEVTRALRALSSAYVERRKTGATRSALDSAGKRAAFAMFYAPLHLLTIRHMLGTLEVDTHAPQRIVDIGCGTGVGGAAWALHHDGGPVLLGLDRHPWAVHEARWNYAQLGLNGRATTGDVTQLPRVTGRDAIVAAYVLNELSDDVRRAALEALVASAGVGARILIVEPISKQVAPWWADTAARLARTGFRADEWRADIARPSLVQKLDQAAGLNHRVVTARSLFHAGHRSA